MELKKLTKAPELKQYLLYPFYPKTIETHILCNDAVNLEKLTGRFAPHSFN